MHDPVYRFRLTHYDAQQLLPQVSRVLEARTRCLSGEKYPGLWRLTNKLNGTGQQNRPFQKALSVFLIAAGLFLFIPGLMEPAALQVPLISGGFAILLGIWHLLRSNRPKKDRVMEKRFDQAAERLLSSKDFTGEQAASVTFAGEGMTIFSGEAPEEQVSYDRFESAVEGSDILLLVWDDRVLLLQKKDLVKGDADMLRALLRENIPMYLLSD